MRDCKIRRFALRLIVRTGLGLGCLTMALHAVLVLVGIAECVLPWYIGTTASFGSAVLSIICGALFVEV